MADIFTERTTIGWGSKIRESIKSVVLGVILFFVAFPTLFLNEGCYVKDLRAFAQGESEVVTISPERVDPANEGKLVHLTGKAATEAVLEDPDFNLSRNAIKLSRNVEMYQWQEKSETKEVKKIGGTTEQETTYTYSKTWSGSLIDSSAFKLPAEHENPDALRFESMEWAAEDVVLGAFHLSESLVEAIDPSNELRLAQEELDQVPDALRQETKLAQGKFYLGQDPATPQVGDLRISYSIVATPQTISFYSGQLGDTFAPFVAYNGRSLELLQTGTHSAKEMFASARQGSKIRTWLLRLGGFLAMTIGLCLILGPLVAVAEVLPFLSSLIGGGVFLFSSVVAFGLSIVTISIAWVFYRPLIGIPLLVIGLLCIGGIFFYKKKRTTPQPQPGG